MIQSIATRFNGKQSTPYLFSSLGRQCEALQGLAVAACRSFLVQTVFIQDSAHIYNFIFPVMALRLIICLVRVRLHVQVYCPEVSRGVMTRIQSAYCKAFGSKYSSCQCLKHWYLIMMLQMLQVPGCQPECRPDDLGATIERLTKILSRHDRNVVGRQAQPAAPWQANNYTLAIPRPTVTRTRMQTAETRTLDAAPTD